jgi:hypothetical protein
VRCQGSGDDLSAEDAASGRAEHAEALTLGRLALTAVQRDEVEVPGGSSRGNTTASGRAACTPGPAWLSTGW